MLATPVALEPGKNGTVATPPARGFLTSCMGWPAPSVPKLPRLVLRETSVPSGAGAPSRFLALTVRVAPSVEPELNWLRSD